MTTPDLNQANEETRQVWNDNAAFWDERMGDGNDWVRVLIWPATLRLLQPRSGERILDVGCGNGLAARRLAALGAEVTAFDFAAEMITRARQRADDPAHPIDYRVLDATDEAALLALGERRFDAAVCSMALFDMADIRPLMRALAQLLRPGGRFVFSVAHPCFNGGHREQVAESEDREGQLVTKYSVKISGYITPTIQRGAAIFGQPKPQLYFHRPLQELLGAVFAAGLVLDGVEEPAFPPDHPPGRNPLWWGANFHEIPPVLVARAIIRQ